MQPPVDDFAAFRDTEIDVPLPGEVPASVVAPAPEAASRDLLKTLFGEDDDDPSNQISASLNVRNTSPSFAKSFAGKRKFTRPLSAASDDRSVGVINASKNSEAPDSQKDCNQQRASNNSLHRDRNKQSLRRSFNEHGYPDCVDVDRDDAFASTPDSPFASEAEEDYEDINMIFGSSGARSTRKERSEHEVRDHVNTFLARMEVATEQDRECIKKKQPAIFKLRMLQEVKETLKNVDMHDHLLRHGLMKVLANWLALLPDHNLPNATIRTAVIDVISALPIETDLVDRKEQLKSSGLGQIIMFLSQLPEETQANRSKCQKLVEKWSRPVYELTSHYGDLRRREEECLGEEKFHESDATTSKNKECATEDPDVVRNTTLGLKHGEFGFRHHALVPEPEAMDYILRPKLLSDPNDIKARTQNADQQRVRKLVGKVVKRKDGVKNGKAHLPSIEGRGMVTYH